MRPSPLRRARVFSFLYFGLKRFRMHTIVDSIPFLLHASLFFFFAGLVAFLLPINRIMMYLICVALVVFLVLYAVLTILPVVRLDCPYRTPLSAFLWSMIQNPFGLFNDSESSARRTMTEAVGDLALKDTKLRDQRALQWTLDSLTDDTELLPFVEAILDIIHGPQGFRRENDALFESLLGTVDVASPLVTRIGAMIARTQGMPQESPLRVHRYTAGHRALWALRMMPSAWNRLFELDQTLLAGVPGGLAASTSLAVRYQAQRWVHGLLGTLCDLLGNHHPSTQVLALVQRLVHLLISHPDPVISPFESLFAPVLPNPCSVPFAELEAMYGESRDSMQTIVDLDKTRCIVTALYDLHDWAYNSLVFMGMFISTTLDDLHLDESDTPFEPLETCYTILSEIESNPPKRSVTEIVITFPTIHNVKFSRLNPPPQDTLARIVFRMLPFFSSCDIREYLVKRRNAQAIQYVLTECDLSKLAQSHIMIESTILEITIVASCLDSDSVAIAFVDAVFAQLSQDAVQKYSVIGTVRYFRRLREANNELDEIRFSSLPPTALLPRIQKICHSELFQEISPLFLPRDVHIPTALESSQIHLANNYIAFLAEFLQNNSILTTKVNLRVFDRFFAPASFEWTTVERAIQHGFFAAILAHTKALAAEPHSRSDMLAISKQLWGSDLFWINWLQGGWSPTVAGIDQSGLELLYESLELYLAAVVPPQGEHSMSVHITDSKRLLAEVQKQLSSTHVVRPSNDSGKKAGVSDEAAEGTSSMQRQSGALIDDPSGANSIHPSRAECI